MAWHYDFKLRRNESTIANFSGCIFRVVAACVGRGRWWWRLALAEVGFLPSTWLAPYPPTTCLWHIPSPTAVQEGHPGGPKYLSGLTTTFQPLEFFISIFKFCHIM